jgi:type II secretion system protein G
MMKIEKGFTLAEVLIVVVIIGVLATLIIPRFFGQQERAVVAEAVGMLSAIRQGEEAWRLENGAYLVLNSGSGAAWNNLGIDDPNNGQWNYDVAASGTVTATRGAGGSNPCTNRTVTLTSAGVWGGTHLYGPAHPAVACN